MRDFVYYIYFDKVGRPEKIVVKTFEEFKEQLGIMIEQAREMPEWIQRVYR